jgi:hypothetical protein
MVLFVKFTRFKTFPPKTMASVLKTFLKTILTSLSFMLFLLPSYASDILVTGTVTDRSGFMVPNARVSMIAGAREYAAMTGTDGSYSLRISGIYEVVSGEIEIGYPYPDPFSLSVNIPFIINNTGDIRFIIYNFAGQKVYDTFFRSVDAGSYHITWDGCDQNGSPQKEGFYVYAITFRGKTKTGKIIKAPGFSTYSSGTALESDMVPAIPETTGGKLHIPVITTVTCTNYYPARLTDITLSVDTIINFELAMMQGNPFRTSGNFIAMNTGTEYRPLLLKGINMGSSPPGYFPGEIPYAITPAQYSDWIKQIADAGFNSIRVYTLHPPVFYETLANYNQRHQDKPLLLFQGIWLDEIEDSSNPESFDLTNRTDAFTKEIHVWEILRQVPE